MKKVSILMPTYNDEKYIDSTIKSVFDQSYENWELIIVDDGSTDNTRYEINKFKDNRIKYIYQDNKDQLNALLNGSNYITGDYVYILHSDDLLPFKDFLKLCVDFIEENDCDALIGNLDIIDKEGNFCGIQKVDNYVNDEKTLAKVLLWLGRNLFNDVPFIKKESFISVMKNNYLINNMPFWYDIKNDFKLLEIKKVNFPFRKYRVFDGNYANTLLGKLNLLNGELRTAIKLMKKYYIPFYKIQYYIYRGFNKAGLGNLFFPFYLKRETKNKSYVINNILKKRFSNNYKNNLFLKAVSLFFERKNNREIDLRGFEYVIYYGKDMRIFNKQLLSNSLPEIYIFLLNEMEKGFNSILVGNEDEKIKVNFILEFLCISDEVNIVVKEKGNDFFEENNGEIFI